MPLIRNTTPTAEPHAPDERKPAELLATGSDEERWIAARNAAETPEALSLLTRALSVERVPRVREAMFTALAKIATPESASVALPYLRSEDAGLRTQALDALRAMPASAAEHLSGLLDDSDPDVRLLACEIARALPTDDASRVLGELLESETNSNVCSAAIEVLAETGDAASLPILARCAARFSADPFMAFAVKTASGRIGSSER
jgi:HEAT repeat protein